MKITVADLRRKQACADAVAFYRQTRLEEINWDNVREIDLSQSGWAEWLLRNWPLTSISRVNTCTYTYDDRGNRLTETDSDGDTWIYTYDDRGNRLTITYPDGDTCTYTYDDRGNRLTKTYPNGHIVTYAPPPITIILTMVDGERITRTNKAPAMITGAKEKHNDG